jgi:hypothetical protein
MGGCILNEPERVKALFEELTRAPLKRFPDRGYDIDAPRQEGVYVIYDPSDRVSYVGRNVRRPTGLVGRLGAHLRGRGSPFRRNILRDNYHFRYLIVENPRLRALLEAYATGCLCPEHIRFGEAISSEPTLP